MAKINLDGLEDLDQLEHHGGKIKNRYKQKKMPKAKFKRKSDNRKPQHRPRNFSREKYENV